MQLRHIALLASLLALVLATVPAMAEDGDAAEEDSVQLKFYVNDSIVYCLSLAEGQAVTADSFFYEMTDVNGFAGWQLRDGDFYEGTSIIGQDFTEYAEIGIRLLKFDAVFETAPPAGGDGEGIELSLEGILTPVLIAFGAVLIGCAAVYLLARRVH